MPYFRSDQAAIHVEVTGVALDKEAWDMMEGGDPVAESTIHFPGGMEPQVPLGGLPKWSQLTVERAWSESLGAIYKTLVAGVGNAPGHVSYVQFNNAKQPQGQVYTYNCVLMSAERPKYKSDESTKAFLKCTFDVEGRVG